MIGDVLVRAVVMMALSLVTTAAAEDAIQVKDFGSQLHEFRQLDSSPATTVVQPYCNVERLTEQIRLLRDRKAELIEEIRNKQAQIMGQEMSVAERARRQADLQRFIDGLVDVLGVPPADSPNDALEAEFRALVRELAEVEKQMGAIIQHIARCNDN